jgi:hypothetical protein
MSGSYFFPTMQIVNASWSQPPQRKLLWSIQHSSQLFASSGDDSQQAAVFWGAEALDQQRLDRLEKSKKN